MKNNDFFSNVCSSVMSTYRNIQTKSTRNSFVLGIFPKTILELWMVVRRESERNGIILSSQIYTLRRVDLRYVTSFVCIQSFDTTRTRSALQSVCELRIADLCNIYLSSHNHCDSFHLHTYERTPFLYFNPLQEILINYFKFSRCKCINWV